MPEETSSSNSFARDLDRNTANFVALTPITLLDRSSQVFPNKIAVIHGDQYYTYRDLMERCRKLASALSRRGVRPGDSVAILAPNVPAMLEAHFGIPMAGAILVALNYRLDAASIAFILDHSEAKVLIVDREFSATAKAALAAAKREIIAIDIADPAYLGGGLVGESDYESFLGEGDPAFDWVPPRDEWDAIALNYTSGTTGDPKGVVYHHRGAYLNALGNVVASGLSAQTVYLWTLPMFHCNGWSHTWAVTAVGGTHVCLRRVDPALIFAAIAEHNVTHLSGAPVVLNMLVHAPENLRRPFDRIVEVATGGAAPPSTIIAGMEKMGFRVTHLYGLTESYGPATICTWQDEWSVLPLDQKAVQMARQGVRMVTLGDMMVADSETLTPVPSDGATVGELMLRGNTVMKGYLKNPKASDAAFRGGWFHTGDLAVRHLDGYVEIKDRSKDVIISGGENISSLEIEEVLYRHPAVMEAAVVAKSDAKWGEVPCAFVTLKPGAVAEADELVAYCRAHMAHFKIPKQIVFGPLPKTSTGKIQKYVLRDRTGQSESQA